MRQIIAMGGGGFSMEPDNLALDRYVITQTGKPRPKVCFIATASGDAPEYILHFYQAFSSLDCHPSNLSLFSPPSGDLVDFVLEKDAVYVGGGSTRNLLALWREWGLDNILRRAYAAGVLLAGVSAGANCWFEQCTSDVVPGEIRMLPALGLLNGSFTPHYHNEEKRRPALQRLLAEGTILPGLAADDSSALHFQDDTLAAAVCSRPEAQVYRVGFGNGQFTEENLEMHLV